jgi:hypothetical protein
MTAEPTKESKTEMDFVYAVDQQVSVNAFLDVTVNGENVRLQITSRYNSSPEKIVKTTKALIDAYVLLREEYPKSEIPTKQASNEPTYHPVDEGTQTLLVARVEVTPKPDNKVELKLYGENDKYPRLYHNGTVDQVLTALSVTDLDWKKEQLTVANSINAKFYADWRNSEKLNSNGKPYKNIVGYRPL